MKFYAWIIFLFIILNACDSDDKPAASSCDYMTEIVSDVEFNQIETANYNIFAVAVEDDCLLLTYASSGCNPDNWTENLVSADENNPESQRRVKMRLINNEECEAVFQKTVSFDLIPLRVNSQHEIQLNIEGWPDIVDNTY